MKKFKTKKQREKRNNSNCVSDYNNSFANLSGSFNSNANRREWDTNTSTKSKE